MLLVKSVIILKAKSGILKCGSGIKTWMWLCVERESYLGFGNSQNEEDRKKYCEAMAMDQRAWEAVKKADSCCDGCELCRLAKQRAGEKKDVVGVSCLEDESGAAKVSVDNQKKVWKEHMEKLMNIENEWSESIDASKVEGAGRVQYGFMPGRGTVMMLCLF